MTYEVRMKLPCCTFTAMNLTYDWFNFPKNDDFSGFWTIGAMSPMGPVQREMVAWTALEEERSTFTTPPRCKLACTHVSGNQKIANPVSSSPSLGLSPAQPASSL